MTPQFTTPCYCRIEDTDQRNEIYAKLDVTGRCLHRTEESEYIFCFNNLLEVGIASSLYGEGIRGTSGKIELDRDSVINCGTDTKLFLALASMRGDTDKGQWFIDEGENIFINNTEKYNGTREVKRLTAQEIIEHFNK